MCTGNITKLYALVITVFILVFVTVPYRAHAKDFSIFKLFAFNLLFSPIEIALSLI